MTKCIILSLTYIMNINPTNMIQRIKRVSCGLPGALCFLLSGCGLSSPPPSNHSSATKPAQIDTAEVVEKYISEDNLFYQIYEGKKIFKIDSTERYITAEVYARTNTPVSRDTAIIKRNLHTGMYEILVPVSHRYMLKLADSTIIWLNASSKCAFHTANPETEHYLSLSGEACVESDSAFTLASESSKITLNHGKVNLKAYPDEEADIATLISGKALLETRKTSALLRPRYVTTIRKSKVATAFHADAESDQLDWLYGFFSFSKNKSWQQLFRAFSRWYGIDLVCDIHDDFQMDGETRLESDLSVIINLFKANGFSVKYELSNDKPKIVFHR